MGIVKRKLSPIHNFLGWPLRVESDKMLIAGRSFVIGLDWMLYLKQMGFSYLKSNVFALEPKGTWAWERIHYYNCSFSAYFFT